MVDTPESPEAKLWIRAKQAEEFGKHFDEALERRVLGLPPVKAGRDPIIILEDRNRTRMTLQEDRTELKEMLEDIEREKHRTTGDRLDDQDTEIQELRRQNAELREQLQGGPRPAPVKPAKEEDPAKLPESSHNHPEGIPDKTWSKPNLRAFMKHYEIVEPAGGSAKMTPIALLDYVVGEGKRMELFEE